MLKKSKGKNKSEVDLTIFKEKLWNNAIDLELKNKVQHHILEKCRKQAF